MTAPPLDLHLGVRQIQPQQDSRGVDARIDSLGADRYEPQHRLVELDVSRIHFDQEVGVAPHAPRVDVRDMKYGSENRF